MSARKPDVTVTWFGLGDQDDVAWRGTRCLYGYLRPRTYEILYLGRAWGTTVRGRWRRDAKAEFWDDLERDRGIYRHATMIGVLSQQPGRRLSFELLTDVESLLIFTEQPWGNIQSRCTRTSRPGLVVRCEGDWPARRRTYVDGG